MIYTPTFLIITHFTQLKDDEGKALGSRLGRPRTIPRLYLSCTSRATLVAAEEEQRVLKVVKDDLAKYLGITSVSLVRSYNLLEDNVFLIKSKDYLKNNPSIDCYIDVEDMFIDEWEQ